MLDIRNSMFDIICPSIFLNMILPPPQPPKGKFKLFGYSILYTGYAQANCHRNFTFILTLGQMTLY